MTDNKITNCPKCGNPLTPGTSACPVCGTPIGTQTAAVPMNNAEVQSTPTPVSSVSNTDNNGGVQTPPIAPTIQPTAPTIQPTPMPTIQPTLNETPMPQGVPIQPVQPVPTVEPVNQPSTPTVTPGVVSNQPDPKKGKIKFKLNNKTLIILLVVILIICGAFVLLKGNGSKGTTTTKKPANTTETVTQKDVVANGFMLKIDNDWAAQSYDGNTIVVNNDASVVIKLEKYEFNLASISKEKLQANFNDLGNEYNPNKIIVSDVNISENKIASKDGYLVNAKVTEDDGKEYVAQYYFINGGSNLTIGATVVYASEEAKTSNEGKITTLLNSLSYASDANSIIALINRNYHAFSVYYNAINGVVLEIPSPEEPVVEEEIEEPIA